MKSSTLPLLWALPSSMFPLQGTKPGIFLLLQGKQCTLESRILKQCHSASLLKWSQFSRPFFLYSFSGWKILCGWKSVCGVTCCHLVALQRECAVVFFFQKVAWKVLKDIHHLTFIRNVNLNRRLRTKERSLLWLSHSYCQIKNDLRILASSDSVFRLHTRISFVYLWQCGTTLDSIRECLWRSFESYLFPGRTPNLGTPQLQRRAAWFHFTVWGHSEDQAFAGQTICR